MTAVVSGDTGIDLVQDNVITTADLQNGAVTGAKLSGAQTGSAPVYGCRAWCVFNGTTTGTNAPTAGGNVTTVTRNSVGSYTINFTTAMPDANYSAIGTCSNDGGGANIPGSVSQNTGQTTSQVTFQVRDGASGNVDRTVVSIAIFR